MTPIGSVEEVLRSIDGVLRVIRLDEQLRDTISILEKGAEGNGAVNGLMDFINEGVWKALSREHCYLLIIDSSEDFGNLGTQKLRMIDEDGQIIGEWVPQSLLDELKSRDDVAFLSEDFVMYMDIKVSGDPHFVIMDMGFDLIDSLDGVIHVSSGSVSGPTDDYLRKEFMSPEVRCWTHIVGFDTA